MPTITDNDPLVVYCAHSAEPGTDPTDAMKMRLRFSCTAWRAGTHIATRHGALPKEGSGNQCALLSILYALDLAHELNASQVEIRSSVDPVLRALRNVLAGKQTTIPNGDRVIAEFRSRLESYGLDCSLKFTPGRENAARTLLSEWVERGRKEVE